MRTTVSPRPAGTPVTCVAVPLALVTVLFLAFSLPRYVGLDPALSRAKLPPAVSWYYPALVVHIAFGTVALVTACLQVWPWLRRHRPRTHRAAGRVYLLGGVLPAGVVVLSITPFDPNGPSVQTAATLLALLWLATSVLGWRAARRRRFAEHREWMVRSVALSFSIVADRLWLPVCFAAFPSEGPGTVPQAIGIALWLSIVVNLVVAEGWLHHTRHRRTPGAPNGRVGPPRAGGETGAAVA